MFPPPIHSWKLLAMILAVLAPVWGSASPMGLSLPLPRVVQAPTGTPSSVPSPSATPSSDGTPTPTTPPPDAGPTRRTTSPTTTTPGTPQQDAAIAQVIVRFTTEDPATREQVLRSTAAAAGLREVAVVRELATGALLARATGSGEAWLAALRHHPGVVAASPNSRITRVASATDPLFAQQWAMPAGGPGVGFTSVWDRTLGEGSRVAVIDSGKTNHPDLAGQFLGGYDFISDVASGGDGNGRDADATDTGDFCGGTSSTWHGTHVAGIIAARRNNGIGVAGAAPAAKVVPVRVLGRCDGEMADLIDAIVWSAGGRVPGMAANPYPARVINMSLSARESCSYELQTALRMARRLGALSVVAAGNRSAQSSTETPGNCAGVLTVAANNKDRALASYSNWGTGVNLAAPGGDDGTNQAILSTWLTNPGANNNTGYSYGWMSGTSMATPYVSAAAALLLSLKPTLSVAQLEQILVSTAVSSPTCSGCGAGILDAAAAAAKVPVLSSATLQGRQLTLSGAGFTSVTQVWIAQQQLTFTRTGDGTLTATIPATVPSGTHAVWVSSNGVISASHLVTLT
ncbi:S8 family serine peptidase [Propionibacteriaceae bacterium Y1923]|uniref:S8 family serine peptidase n=1 Tax=Aestuariimicrobium sp. Y1814 TaxID=3418742 RepID=UPI003C1F26B8